MADLFGQYDNNLPGGSDTWDGGAGAVLLADYFGAPALAGAATATLGLTGTVTGKVAIAGSAGATLALSAVGSGRARIAGDAAVAFDLTGSIAAGARITSDVRGGLEVAGAAGGVVAVRGEVAGILAFGAQASGLASRIVGQVFGEISLTGAGDGRARFYRPPTVSRGDNVVALRPAALSMGRRPVQAPASRSGVGVSSRPMAVSSGRR